MYKYLYILIAIFFFPILTKAQDTLFLRQGKPIQAKIMEIKPDIIIYKKYTYQDGPSITIPKNTVSFIKYPDGSIDSIPSMPELSLPENVSEKDRNTGSVYFYRPSKMLSSARVSDIYVNDSFLFKIGNGKMRVIELPAGQYLFKSKIDAYVDSVEIKVEAGKYYYFKCHVKGSTFKDTPELLQMGQKEGNEEVSEMEKIYRSFNKPKEPDPKSDPKSDKKKK